MSKNKIKKIENLDKLVKLRCLALQANRIVKIENLEKLVNLEELYISENGIEKIENLEENKGLTTLDLAKNRLSSIDNVAHLTDLEEFWVSNLEFSIVTAACDFINFGVLCSGEWQPNSRLEKL